MYDCLLSRIMKGDKKKIMEAWIAILTAGQTIVFYLVIIAAIVIFINLMR